MTKPPYLLVPDTLSTDTVEALAALHDHAKRGQIVGLIYGCLLKRRGFIVNSAGELYRSPTFARGICAALDDSLSLRIRGGTP